MQPKDYKGSEYTKCPKCSAVQRGACFMHDCPKKSEQWTCPKCDKVQDNKLRCTGCGYRNSHRGDLTKRSQKSG